MALKKVGALWTRANKQNQEYLAGEIDLGISGTAKIMVFRNDKKEDKHPDYRISLVTDDALDKK